MKKIPTLFKRLGAWCKRFVCNLSMLPVDELIAITGEEHVSIWNGINYSGEFRFKDPQDKSGAWGDAKKTPWLQIAFGRYVSGYGDWGGGLGRCCDSMVKIRIDENLTIRDIIRESPFYNQKVVDKKQEKKVDALLKRIKVGDTFSTANPKLTDWIGNIFAVPEEIRYAHCANITHIFTWSWEQKKWYFEEGH